MKKIPTLFERTFENHRVVGITDKVTAGMEWVLEGEGVATLKIDGSCCAIINGEFYKRYDAKKGKKPPEGAIPCCLPDPITGHHPHWVKVTDAPADKWFMEALRDYMQGHGLPANGTYEAVGVHFQGNPYCLDKDTLIPHGTTTIPAFPRTFEGMRDFLRQWPFEGVVFWKDGEPRCKIKRSDFGFDWGGKKMNDYAFKEQERAVQEALAPFGKFEFTSAFKKEE